MVSFPEFVERCISEIQAELDALPPDYVGERDADGLGIDLAFYGTALEVWRDYVDEAAHALKDGEPG